MFPRLSRTSTVRLAITAVAVWAAAPAIAQQAGTTTGGAPSSTGPTFPVQTSPELAQSGVGTARVHLPDSTAEAEAIAADRSDRPSHSEIAEQGGRTHAEQ